MQCGFTFVSTDAAVEYQIYDKDSIDTITELTTPFPLAGVSGTWTIVTEESSSQCTDSYCVFKCVATRALDSLYTKDLVYDTTNSYKRSNGDAGYSASVQFTL